MSTAVLNATSRRPFTATAALKAAAGFWFLTAAVGQVLFVYYIVVHYVGPTLAGQFESWNSRDLIKGYVAGDKVGNLGFAAHVLVAGLITASGMLQLFPQIRARAPRFHRWNGRVYLTAALLMSIDGLWLVWVRGTYLHLMGASGITLLAVLTLVSAGMTLRTALARQFVPHNRWALRTFLLVNGVWFQRIGYMAWIILNKGPVGIGKRMDGPFDIFWGFGSFLVPLAVLELYLLAGDRPGAAGKLTMAVVLTVCGLLTGLGSFGAYMFMWKPAL
jgi:hypothetical protein